MSMNATEGEGERERERERKEEHVRKEGKNMDRPRRPSSSLFHAP